MEMIFQYVGIIKERKQRMRELRYTNKRKSSQKMRNVYILIFQYYKNYLFEMLFK